MPITTIDLLAIFFSEKSFESPSRVLVAGWTNAGEDEVVVENASSPEPAGREVPPAPAMSPALPHGPAEREVPLLRPSAKTPGLGISEARTESMSAI